VDKNEQDFYRENIMLFLPWRDEKTDLLDINCKQVYETNIDQIKKLYQQFNKVEETQLDDNEIQIEGEQGRNNNQLVDDEDWVPDDVLINDVGDYVENTNTSDVDSPKDGGKIIVHLIDNEQFKDLIGCLNDGQRQLLYHTTNVIRSQLWGKGHTAMKVFVTGPAGAGKSMLIRALAQSVIRIANLRPDIDDLSLPPVLLTAPTGKAAYGIKGLTLHSAFKLPLNQFAGLLPKLSSDISNTLRCQFANVKLLIIDEISMVGIKTLGYIDQRLRSILRINKPFGDINVIVFGDFFQLAPVLATPLYDSFEEILSKFPSAVEMLSIKSIWETFKFYELTEIMRQKDDKQFAIMLTKLARGQLEEADVKYFQNLITHLDITFQPQVMHLWATNNEVDEMNKRVLNSMNQVSFISEAIDTSAKRSDIESAKKLPRQKTMGLALRLVLKETAKYMVIANISTEDGIVNGAIGELMQINKGQTAGGKEVAKRVWIKFDEPEVGSLTRQKIRDKLKPEGEHTDDMCKWTPIEIIKLEFQIGNAEHHKVTRMQLPLVEALALTVHKSQGATYKSVAFHIPQKLLKCNMLYVGCSRATSAQGLRIDYFPAKPPKPSAKVEHEMCRLRTPSCALIPRFSRIMTHNMPLSCMSHNIRSLKKYEAHINADIVLLQSKIMFFQETGSKSTDTYTIKNHTECCRIDSIHANGKSGSICFVGESINHKEITCSTTLLQDQKKNTHLEAIEVIIENITYIGIYSSPNFPVQKLCDFIETVASAKNNVIFIGDFNINFNKPPKQLVQILKHFNYKILVDGITTDHGTTIDNVITNVDIAALVYESLISDHRPILVMDIDTFKEIEKYSETVDDQIVQEEVKNNFIKPNVPAIDGFPVEKSKKSIKSTKVLNNNNLDDIEFIQVDSDTILVPETKTKSTKIVDYNIIINDIQFIQVNSNTLKVPENCNIRSDSLLETISDNATVSKNPKTIKISSIKNKVDITSSSTFCGFTNTDGVSCYANSVIQVLFNCQSLVNEIRNNQLGPTLQHSLHEYTSNSGSCDTRTIREYLDNETILYTLQQQQDCIEFLEALMDHSRPTFESLFGFQELYTIRCNTCKHTTANNAPTSLILHFEIPQHRSQTLQTLFSTNQNVWNTLDDYKCNNCNNIGSSEDKHQIIVANEYIVIQLKLFIPTFVNGQFVPNKITDLKLSGVPTSILEIAGAQYKTQAAILHMGENTSSGHYIAYLRQGTSNWVCANDTIVAEKRWPNNSKDVYVIILKRM